MCPYSLPSIGFIAVAVAMVLVFAFTSFGAKTEDVQATLKATAAEGKYVDLESNQGRLRGYIRNSRQGREYIAFYKVPYAKSPIGELRFMEPQPVESWEGLRDEKEVAPQCIQKEKVQSGVEAVGKEDCLYFNLYTPSVDKQSQYPTMVYFHGGSGANLCRNYFLIPHPNPSATVIEVGKLLNCSTSSSTEILECLRSKPAADIAVVGPLNTSLSFSMDSTSSSVFLPDTPFNLLTNKKANKVPYIMGITSEEEIGTALDILHDPELVKKLNENWSDHASDVLGENHLTKDELNSIKTFYFGDKLIGNNTVRNLTNMLSDWKLVHCTYLSATMHGEQSDTYLYYFSKPGAKSYAEKHDPNFNATARGYVAHGDVSPFHFLFDEFPEIPFGDPNYYPFSEYFVRLWSQFATSGNPSGVDGLEWGPTTSRENAFWFELNDNPGRTHVLDERMRFWDQFSNTKLNYE
ncbi:Fatty acyl-CoA hydrolase precursor, medium chain [Orchesella cincta]|uniref:Fatty acyl-CoA hydrolase, medium chain n=1 Tax=Orchesella cincta TaxID=48709 RepID=A0A1D2MNX0_ORCCI|nr:Fatty acyl-CoA hydrolase precursor, medium chain [Orchesella cincta]